MLVILLDYQRVVGENMSTQDFIGDFLTRLRNGQMAGKDKVVVPSSRECLAISKILQEEGYITAYSQVGDATKRQIEIVLKYFNGQAVMQSIQRVSKPSGRVYRCAKKIARVLGGLGITIVSTSQGVMTDKTARALGVGGEVWCTVH